MLKTRQYKAKARNGYLVMNDRQFERKVAQDAARVKKNVNNLVEDGVNQLGDKVEKLAEDAKTTFVNTSATVKKDLGQSLSQYNSKAQEYAEKVPGGLAEKVAQYPWVAISIGVGIGVILAGLLKPSHRS